MSVDLSAASGETTTIYLAVHVINRLHRRLGVATHMLTTSFTFQTTATLVGSIHNWSASTTDYMYKSHPLLAVLGRVDLV